MIENENHQDYAELKKRYDRLAKMHDNLKLNHIKLSHEYRKLVDKIVDGYRRSIMADKGDDA